MKIVPEKVLTLLKNRSKLILHQEERSMKKLHQRISKLSETKNLVSTLIVARHLNHKMLDKKFGIREDRFLNMHQEIELTLSKPTIYVVRSEDVLAKVNLKAGEHLFLVKQHQEENFV
jgi:hypothetical protein